MATHCDIINAKFASFKFSLTSKTFPSNGLHSKAEKEPESWDPFGLALNSTFLIVCASSPGSPPGSIWVMQSTRGILGQPWFLFPGHLLCPPEMSQSSWTLSRDEMLFTNPLLSWDFCCFGIKVGDLRAWSLKVRNYFFQMKPEGVSVWWDLFYFWTLSQCWKSQTWKSGFCVCWWQ